jgi:branched-chain amino acid transport system substrate-binding protein
LTRGRKILPSLLLAIALVAAACGGDDDTSAGDTTETTAPPTESDPGVSETEIRVGVSAALTGQTGFFGKQTVGAINAYVGKLNDAGGINGRKVTTVVYDNKGEQGQDLANIRKLFEQDEVVALLLSDTTGSEDYIERNRIPTFVIGTEPTAYSSKYPHIHPIAEHYLAFSQQLPQALKEEGTFKEGMKVAILYDPASNGPYLDYIKEAWTLQGAEVVSTDPWPSTSTDCSSLVVKVENLDIDFWDFEGANTWFVCMKAAERRGFKPAIGWGSYATSLSLLHDLVGKYSEGTYSGNFVDKYDGRPRELTAAHQEYRAALEKYSPDVADPVQAASPVTQSNWITSKLLSEALEAQGEIITRDGINEWVNSQENWDPGLNPPIISLAPDCKTGTGSAWFGRWTWESGEPEIIPFTGYIPSPLEKHYGGKCYLTEIADKVMGV